jgi:hypothetical protein
MLVVVIAMDSRDVGDKLVVEEWVVRIRYMDPRIYLLKSLCGGAGVQEQWEEEMRGGESIWDKAIRYTRQSHG